MDQVPSVKEADEFTEVKASEHFQIAVDARFRAGSVVTFR